MEPERTRITKLISLPLIIMLVYSLDINVEGVHAEPRKSRVVFLVCGAPYTQHMPRHLSLICMNGGRSEHVAVLNKTFPYAGAFYNNYIGGDISGSTE